MVLGYEVRSTNGLVAFTRYHGFHLEAAGACEVRIRDGSATGAVLGGLTLAAAGRGGPGPLPAGVATANGIWVEVVSGTPSVTVFGV